MLTFIFFGFQMYIISLLNADVTIWKKQIHNSICIV